LPFRILGCVTVGIALCACHRPALNLGACNIALEFCAELLKIRVRSHSLILAFHFTFHIQLDFNCLLYNKIHWLFRFFILNTIPRDIMTCQHNLVIMSQTGSRGTNGLPKAQNLVKDDKSIEPVVPDIGEMKREDRRSIA
jgi:hypothetical protein